MRYMRTAAPPGGGIRASAGAAFVTGLCPAFGADFLAIFLPVLGLAAACLFAGFLAVFLPVLGLVAACLFLAMVTPRRENEGMRRARHSRQGAPKQVRTHWEE